MGFFAKIPPQRAHQIAGIQKLLEKRIMFDMSDPGTGKTRTVIDAIAKIQADNKAPFLVLAPRAILRSAWEADCKKFTPGMITSIATADNRAAAFNRPADIYVTNHDATKWILENIKSLPKFQGIVIDESRAYMNPRAARTKAMTKIMKYFAPTYRVCMNGTPNSTSVTELWSQAFLLDEGERLGNSYYKFRLAVQSPTQVGRDPRALHWEDKPGAFEAVADLLSDISVRNRLEDCVDIPENNRFYVPFQLNTAHRNVYREFIKDRLIEHESGTISALNAAHLKNKLLQIASGAVYTQDKLVAELDTARVELALDLAEARHQCVVAFQWKHQRDQLINEAEKREMTYGVIDGATTNNELPELVESFQAGRLKLLFVQPQSASHGLTLTAGTTTIWVSPTSVADRFKQLNHRIYRSGQTKRTETIMIHAEDTVELDAYGVLEGRLKSLDGFLELIRIQTTTGDPTNV